MWNERLIGWAMRVYRASPLHPRLGRVLALCLARVNGGRQRSVRKNVGGIEFELDLGEVIDASLYYSGSFEADAERSIAASLEAGCVAIDIGANFGYHSFAMARRCGPAGRVIAIEPTSWAFAKLRRNAALNPFTNIDFLRLGLGDADLGEITTAFQSSYRLDGQSSMVEERIEIRRLDTLVAQLELNRLDFIKLDVDGHEARVLRGARQTLARFRPQMLFEITPSALRRNGDDPGELIGMLLALGYNFRTEAGAPIADIHRHCAAIADGLSANLLALPPR